MSECYKSFTYDGYSTDAILDVPLALATFGGLDSITGISRDILKGGVTVTRPVPNEYGTVADSCSFEYSLIKSDFEPFTEEEQRTVEKWLTSPKFSTDLVLYDVDDNEICIYCGLFTNTSWIPHSRGYAGVEFTFECNSAYPYKQYEKNYTVSPSETITVNCESDELNEYIYPILSVRETAETAVVIIKNNTDDENAMTVRAYDRVKMIFDCQYCIPTDDTVRGIISYEDLGWDDVGNIYWLRLLPGDNEIEITVEPEEEGAEINGEVEIGISYRCPYKLVGGWI